MNIFLADHLVGDILLYRHVFAVYILSCIVHKIHTYGNIVLLFSLCMLKQGVTWIRSIEYTILSAWMLKQRWFIVHQFVDCYSLIFWAYSDISTIISFIYFTSYLHLIYSTSIVRSLIDGHGKQLISLVLQNLTHSYFDGFLIS